MHAFMFESSIIFHILNKRPNMSLERHSGSHVDVVDIVDVVDVVDGGAG